MSLLTLVLNCSEEVRTSKPANRKDVADLLLNLIFIKPRINDTLRVNEENAQYWDNCCHLFYHLCLSSQSSLWSSCILDQGPEFHKVSSSLDALIFFVRDSVGLMIVCEWKYRMPLGQGCNHRHLVILARIMIFYVLDLCFQADFCIR